MKLARLFITATDTDVGKTIISAAIMDAAHRAGECIQYWKPVQTGGEAIDRHCIEAMLGRSLACSLPSLHYQLAASPEQAAAHEKKVPPRLEFLTDHLNMPRDSGLLIEGAGGLMVPLNEKNETWLELLRISRIPTLLVARSGLGTINHTILSIDALDHADVPILAIVLNGPIHEDNLKSLKRMRPQHRFLQFPELALQTSSPEWMAAADRLWRGLPSDEDRKPQGSTEWEAMDNDFVWHPYTQHQTAPQPIPIVRGRGIYLETSEGEQLIDASSSWWTCSVGHGHPKVGHAIRKQQARLDHSIFAGATHEPAARLAAELIKKTDGRLHRAFYSDNGSCSVEVALKIAAQSWQNKGIPEKRRFLFFRGAYHGDTFGAMSVAASDTFHKAFKPYMFEGISATPVTTHRSALCPSGDHALNAGCQELESIMLHHSHELAGVIIEPWLQGASGMNIQDLRWLQHLSRLCKTHDVPLILDEVFTGMGRVGSYFAFLRAEIEPDIVCMAKGLTGGNLPLAVTLCHERIFDSFLADDRSKALLHGHTYTGNPIACAAALATLEIYQEEGIIESVLETEGIMHGWMQNTGAKLRLENGRTLGALMAWELPGTGLGNYFHPLALKLPPLARKHGLLMRTLGNTVYFAPPLCINEKELGLALSKIENCMSELIDNS